MRNDNEQNEVDDVKLHDLLFGVRRSVRYHNRRRLFFDRFNKCSDALTAVFGSATIIALVSEKGNITLYMAGLTAILSAVNLVFDTKGHARLHHDLARDFISIEKKLIDPELTAEELTKAEATRLDVEAEEPPALRVLDLICHNELTKAMGYDDSQSFHIGFWRSMFANLFDFFPSSIEKKPAN